MKRSYFGEKIAHLRRTKGLSQQDLATKAGLTKRMIAYYELSEKIDFVDKIEKLTTALNISVSELFNEKNKKKENIDFDLSSLNPRVSKKLKKILLLNKSDRTKIYEQIELFLSKDEYKSNK